MKSNQSALVALAALLSGCMSMSPLPNEGGGVKSGGAVCSTFTGLAGVKAKVVQVSSDAGVIKNGTVRVQGDCESIEFTTAAPAKAASAP